jgi:dihydroxy-acid dehydratase
MAALVGAGLGESVAVVTDGELSGLNSGITIGQVMPEAAEGGPLGVVRDGDTVVIDLMQRTIELDLPTEVLARRLAGYVPVLAPPPPGWLALYRDQVQSLSRGAVLGHRAKT